MFGIKKRINSVIQKPLIKMMIIKVIDGISKVTGIFLGFAFPVGTIWVAITILHKPIDGIVLCLMVILLVPVGLALFFAVAAREKSESCRLGVALLMLPTFVFFLNLSANIGCLFNHKRDELKLLQGDIIVEDVILNGDIVTLVSLLIVILYIVQYYLLFKGEKVMEVQTELQSSEETDAVKLPAIDGIIIQDGQKREKIDRLEKMGGKLLKEKEKMGERTIKIIDWVTRIVAIYLAITTGWVAGKYSVMWHGGDVGGEESGLLMLFLLGFIMMSPLQVGLFLAPRLRQKAVIWRLVCAILMVPGGIFCFSVVCVLPIQLLRGEFKMVEIGYIIGAMCYAIQYYLLLKDILLKPIYLSLVFKQMLRRLKTLQNLKFRKMREMTIKIIDWMTRIVAISLAISFGGLKGEGFVMVEGEEWGDKVLILFLLGFIRGFIIMSTLQLGLFLAPLLRQKAVRWRLVCAILMVPGGIFCFGILLASPINLLKLLRGEFGMVEMGYIVGAMVYAMCYAIQYYLLLKDILLKPIYLSLVFKQMLRRLKTFQNLKFRKRREMTIKIIDWMTWIEAICIAIRIGWEVGKYCVMVEGEEWGDEVLILFLLGSTSGFIIMSTLQGGLFLAPLLRQKAVRWRLVCAILMVPGGIFCFGILLALPINLLKLLRGEFGMVEIGYSIGAMCYAMCYAIQYYLLLKDILLKPIYLSSLVFKRMLRRLKPSKFKIQEV